MAGHLLGTSARIIDFGNSVLAWRKHLLFKFGYFLLYPQDKGFPNNSEAEYESTIRYFLFYLNQQK